jgi:hypothetical protein
MWESSVKGMRTLGRLTKGAIRNHVIASVISRSQKLRREFASYNGRQSLKMPVHSPFSRCLSFLCKLGHHLQRHSSFEAPEHECLRGRLSDVFNKTWNLGLTSFGGLAVHFQTLHSKFVEGEYEQGG